MVNWLSVAEDASRPAVSICIRVLHRQSTTILYSHFVGAHFILNVLQTRYLTQTRRHIVSTVLKIQLKIPENSGRTQPTGGIQTRSSVRVWYLDNFCFLIILIVTSRHEAKCFGSRVKCSHEFYFTDANFRYLKGLIESCGEVGGGDLCASESARYALSNIIAFGCRRENRLLHPPPLSFSFFLSRSSNNHQHFKFWLFLHAARSSSSSCRWSCVDFLRVTCETRDRKTCAAFRQFRSIYSLMQTAIHE